LKVERTSKSIDLRESALKDKNVRLKNEFKKLVNDFNELMKKFVPKQEFFEKRLIRFSRIVKKLDLNNENLINFSYLSLKKWY
jgi:hypothetical protein